MIIHALESARLGIFTKPEVLSMNETIRLVLTIVQVLVSLALILTVIFQSGKQAGISGSVSGAADTFFGKNKARSLDAKLEKLTTITAICFIVLTFVLTVL